MLNPKVINCKECGDIPNLIRDIDCKLSEVSGRLYNNIVFSLNLYVSQTDVFDLLTYRRILEYKLVNPNYVCKFDIPCIVTRIKILTAGCKRKCPCYSIPIPEETTTTTSSTSSSTTTTTTTIAFDGSYGYQVRRFNCLTCEQTTLYNIFNNVQLEVGKFYTSSVGTVQVLSYLGIDEEGPEDYINILSGVDTCSEITCPENYVSQFTGATPSSVCNAVTNLAVYSFTPDIQVGTTLYTNPELTGTFNDTSGNYRSFSYYPFLQTYFIKISNVGVVLELGEEICI